MDAVTARGFDTTAANADATVPRLGWLANHRVRSAADAPLMADRARSICACAPGGKLRLTPAVDDPGVIVAVALVAPGKRASIAVCTAAVAAAVSALANVICVVTAVGAVVADASDETAADTDESDRLGVLANQLLAVDADVAAALMADEAAVEATAP